MNSSSWVLLGSALIPVILAVAVYYFGWKLGKRHDEEQEKLDQRRLDQRG